MQKVIITIVVVLIGVVGFAQKDNAKRMKYVTTAPDGSIAMTIYDDTREDSMKLESANHFYRFEILEPTTSEAIYSGINSGKECTIDKSKLAAGTYDLRLYTASFVITSKITITAPSKMKIPAMPVGDIIAANNYDQ